MTKISSWEIMDAIVLQLCLYILCYGYYFIAHLEYLDTKSITSLPEVTRQKRVCDLRVVRHGIVKSIQSRSTVTNPTMEPF